MRFKRSGAKMNALSLQCFCIQVCEPVPHAAKRQGMQTSISQFAVKFGGNNAMENERDLVRQKQACAEHL
eukprot:2618045-Amphidinium_carterae.1